MATVANTPPLAKGRQPVVGHALRFMRDPVSLLREGYRDRGEVFSLRFGNKNNVVILGPDNNKFFFSETDKLLSIRESYPFFLKMFCKDFYFFAPQEEYMKQREIVMPKFKGEQMRSYVPLMVEETQALIESLGGEGEFDLIPTLGPLVMNIAAHAFLGRDFRGKLDSEFFDDFRDFSGGMDVIFPLWLPLPHLRKSRSARKKLDRLLAGWIAYRREHPADPPDFFQNLIEAKLSDGEPISEELMINLILLLVWAGHETTAGQISWTLIDLLQHPDYLEQTRYEMDSIMGARDIDEMDWRDARDLIKMELAIKESERLHPVAYILARKAKADIEIGGYCIPRGTLLFAAPSVTHRMPTVFKDPHVYRPGRFTPGAGEHGPETNRLIGFGGGLHRCAGVNFARLEMRIVLTLITRAYDLELIDEPRPVSGPMTYWPGQPCRVHYKRRTPNTAAAATPPREPQTIPASSGCPFHTE